MCSKPMFECHQATHTGNAFEPRLAHKRAQTSWRPNSRPRQKGNVRASQNQTEPNRTKRGKNIPPGPRAHAPHQYSPGSRLAVIFRNRCEPKVGLLWPSAPGAHKTSDGRGGRSQDTNSQARAATSSHRGRRREKMVPAFVVSGSVGGPHTPVISRPLWPWTRGALCNGGTAQTTSTNKKPPSPPPPFSATSNLTKVGVGGWVLARRSGQRWW